MCLSTEDCVAILKIAFDHDNYKFSNFSLDPIAGKESSKLLLTVNLETEKGNKRQTFFVKKPGPNSGSLQREKIAYDFLSNAKAKLSELQCNVAPKFYYATKEDAMVMENLAEKDYKGAGAKLDKLQMLKAIEALAKFHAITLAYEEIKDCRYAVLYSDPLFTKDPSSPKYKFIESCISTCHKLLELNEYDESIKGKLRASVTKISDLLNEKNSFRNVISHGDLWAGNCLFSYDGKGKPACCKLVDFKFVRYAPPAHDLTMLVYSSSTRELQQENLEYYYNYYYDALKAQLTRLNIDVNKILPKDDFEKTCRLYMGCAKLLWLFKRLSEKCKVVSVDAEIEYLLKEYVNVICNDYVQVEDCFQVVNEHLQSSNYDLLDYEVEVLDRGGFLGEHLNLKVEVNMEGEVQTLPYFVKNAPVTVSQKNFANESGAFLKESRFYSLIAPEFKKKQIDLSSIIAKCYLAREEMLVFQDAKAAGFVVCDKRKSLELATFKSGLVSLARLHASGIAFEEVTGKTLIHAYPEEFEEAFYTIRGMSKGLVDAGKKGFSESIKLLSNHTSTITPQQFELFGHKIFDNFNNFTKPSSTFRNTIVHADLWANNMMFNPSTNQAILIDFQLYRYRPPAQDVMQYLYLCTDPSFRKTHTKEVLEFYYGEFKSVLEEYKIDAAKVLTYEDFLRSCERERTFAAAQAVSHFQNIMITSEMMEELFADGEFLNKSLFVDRSEHVRLCIEKDPIFKEKNREAVQDFRDICESLLEQSRAKQSKN